MTTDAPEVIAARSSPGELLMKAEQLYKSYGGIPVLTDVGIEVRRNEVLGLAGENGAGKSTLLNLLSGVIQPDAGRLVVRGQETRLDGYLESNGNGIFRVFQEPALVPNLPVFENLFLAHENRFMRFGVLRRSAMIRRAASFLDEFEHGWVDPAAETASFDLSVRRILEIVKAFAMAEFLNVSSPVLLLDEPTSNLQGREAEFLLRILERIRARAGVVFAGHHLTELLEVSDRILVLKDGQMAGLGPAEDFTEESLQHRMVGRERSTYFYKENQQRQPGVVPVLEVRHLNLPGKFANLSLEVRAGEIVGVAGIIGSGKSAVGRAIWGAEPKVTGDVLVNGTPVESARVMASLRAGLGYVPPERSDGLLLSQPVAWNISLASLSAHSGWRSSVLNLREEVDSAKRHVHSLNVKARRVGDPVDALSGGNQQKVLLARWLAFGVKALILDSPTRGIDVGAREDIYDLLRQLADQGVAVLLIGDDLPELIGLSTRLLLMKSGFRVDVIDATPGYKPSEDAVLRRIV